MFSKLFKRKDSQQKPASQAAVAEQAPRVPRPETPSLLQQLTGGAAIDTLTDAELLHQLVKNSDKLDKKTNRQVRERLQFLREQEKQQQQQREKQEKICGRLETLARLQHHPLFDSELAHLQQQWQLLLDVNADVAARVQAAIVQCQNIQQAAQALLQQLAAEAAAEAERQEQKLARAAADAAAKAQFVEQQQVLVEVAAAQQQQSQTDRAKHDAQQQEVSRNLQQQLAQLEVAIDNADAKKARELHDRARDNVKKLDQKHVHAFDGKLHLLSGQLRELQDWQAFAALPKLEELCAAMEKLIDTALPPQQKADAVRELQNQWRATKPPTGKQAQALWERFKQASDRAWEPCAAYFDKEKQLRAFNLQQRQAICDALEQFHAAQNWERADWKAVARILEKARQEFHDFHPVERGEEKGIRARFDSAMAAINDKLLTEQKNNEDKKRQLVEAAKNIASMNDLDKAAERVRQLQEQWKQIGLTRRHEDQKLWQQLQEQTARVFDRRRENQQQQRQAQHDNVDRAKQLCESIAALAALSDADLAQSGAEFDRLQAEYKAITDIPEKSQMFLKKQFYTACDRYRDQLAGINKRQREAQVQELARRARLCAQLEQQATAPALAAVQEQWQQMSLPAEWEQAIEKRRQQALAAAQAGEQPDYVVSEEQLRELCIELEILMDAETPDEDRQRRRDFQMRRLQQGLGQNAGNRREQQERLQIAWYCASPAAPSVQQVLQARFDAAQQGAQQKDRQPA